MRRNYNAYIVEVKPYTDGLLPAALPLLGVGDVAARFGFNHLAISNALALPTTFT